MLGVVFTEFMEMVEDKFSMDVADTILEKSEVADGGAFTAVGNYSHEDMVKLVVALSEEVDIPVPDLVMTFGTHLFGRFGALYPVFFEGVETSFDFLDSVEDRIHVEVRKLYPDAQLPSFDTQRLDPNTLEMIYTSDRPFADLAHGLIAGCGPYFNERLTIDRQKIDDRSVRFLITRHGE